MEAGSKQSGSLRLMLHNLSSWTKGVKYQQHKHLLNRSEVPIVLREPFIKSGYRQLNKPWLYYLLSFFQLHNETLNVWTHVGGFVLVLLRLIHFLQDYNVFQDSQCWPVLTFGVSCLMAMLFSASAHLLHSRSEWHHHLMFLLDYAGVTFYSFGTGIAGMFVCSSKTVHDAMRPVFLAGNVLLCWVSFFTCCVAKLGWSHDTTKRKVLMIAGVVCHAIFISLPVLGRYTDCVSTPGCSLWSLHHITIVFALLILSAIFFTAHVPERWLPGSCDIYCHGHQIFHINSVVTMLLQFKALAIDVKEHDMQGVAPTFNGLLVSLSCLILIDFITLIYFLKLVRCKEHKS